MCVLLLKVHVVGAVVLRFMWTSHIAFFPVVWPFPPIRCFAGVVVIGSSSSP